MGSEHFPILLRQSEAILSDIALHHLAQEQAEGRVLETRGGEYVDGTGERGAGGEERLEGRAG